MTSGTPINQFLLSIYELSFPSILNIPFPSGDILENCHNLDAYLSKYFPHLMKQFVQQKMEFYNKEISPFIKLSPLLDFLDTLKNFPFQNLLDFGCGKGYMFNYLRCFRPSISRITGIDTDLNVLNCINNKNSLILSLLPKIPKYLPINEIYDVCIIISTLHHINRNEQRDILRHITHLLRDGGILYIYEDSWGKEYLSIEKTFADLDEQFNRLPLDDKQNIYLSNEYWSNSWCFNRDLSYHRDNYKSIDEWIDDLISVNLEITRYSSIGFDPRRLHGVPASWIIAQKFHYHTENMFDFTAQSPERKMLLEYITARE